MAACPFYDGPFHPHRWGGPTARFPPCQGYFQVTPDAQARERMRPLHAKGGVGVPSTAQELELICDPPAGEGPTLPLECRVNA